MVRNFKRPPRNRRRLVVDSDNILSDSYMEVHNCLSKYPIYTILNFESYSPDSLFIKRSRLVEA
ncbi:MAG: hypothetical protein QXR18_06645 [Pyrobaculum sp.]